MVKNPFLILEPSGELLGTHKQAYTKLREKVKKALKGGVIIVLRGQHGSGRTYLLQKIEEELKKKKKLITIYETASPDIISDLENLPKEKKTKKEIIIFIDNADFLKELNKKYVLKLAEKIVKLSKEGYTIITSMTKLMYNRIVKLSEEFGTNSSIVEIPPLTLKETETLVKQKMAQVHGEKGKGFYPFTEKEIKEIWTKSHGNAKMVLLFCAYLFDEKMKG